MDPVNQYTRIPDSQVLEKTGKTSTEWYDLLDGLGGPTRRGVELVDLLASEHGLSKYWARTVYIRYQWASGQRTE